VRGDRRTSTAALLSLSMLSLACGRSAPAAEKSAPPARVTAGVTEATLTTVTLSPEASRRLGIETAPIEERGVTRSRTVGGDVIPAGGTQSTVTAPVAGTLEAGRGMPGAGASVARGAVVTRLVPLAPAERDVRIEAERAVNEARGRQVLAAQRVERATKLAADGSGSRRAAEEAQADAVVANAALEAAEDRLALAARGVSATGALALAAPYDGVIQALHAAAGQTVAAGAPLFDLVRLDPVWIRVPLYAGDVEQIDRRGSARIVPLGSTETVAGVAAQPVTAPPSADPSTAAVDLYYAASNAAATLRPGQRVSVRVPLASATRSLVAPRAALLHDAYGGSWVYEAREGHVFVRRRVSVVDLVGELAVLDQGPPPGTRVVTVGAGELFGTEFGVGK
jgi:membrane fusion protein, heavy metal efflux system